MRSKFSLRDFFAAGLLTGRENVALIGLLGGQRTCMTDACNSAPLAHSGDRLTVSCHSLRLFQAWLPTSNPLWFRPANRLYIEIFGAPHAEAAGFFGSHRFQEVPAVEASVGKFWSLSKALCESFNCCLRVATCSWRASRSEAVSRLAFAACCFLIN